MNLLDQFILQHVQVSILKSELVRTVRESGMQDARVELNLTPRVMENDADIQLPSYQVSARLKCESGAEKSEGPVFNAKVGLEAVYRQIAGEPMDINEFTSHHATLARQIYPLLQQEMRFLLARMGLSQVQLPFDLAPRPQESEGEAVEISTSLH